MEELEKRRLESWVRGSSTRTPFRINGIRQRGKVGRAAPLPHNHKRVFCASQCKINQIISPTPFDMSRQTAAPRALSLTEELEKLEQSITLTLQEIDSNFSKAHRIVTTSILPIVEDYARHSNDVWEGSKVSTSVASLHADTDSMHSFGNNSSKPPPTSPFRATKRMPTKMTTHTVTRPPPISILRPTMESMQHSLGKSSRRTMRSSLWTRPHK